jgi:DNA-binding beta-propeller fold protein YncE
LALPALLAGACDDEQPAGSPDAAAPAADAAAGGDAGTASEAGAAGAAAGLVVVHSDYKATVVSLVDPATGTLTRDDCINSGSKPAKLTDTLSGDVVVPTMIQPGHEVLLIDRQNATLTWVAPATCEVSRQLNVGEGKPTNPQDVIPVSAHKAYVTRYAGVASDLLIIDPAAATILGHVDLRPLAPTAGNQAVLANPSRGLLVDGKVYVVLTALSEDSKAGGPGRVLIVDPASDSVVDSIDLPALKNCASIAAAGSAVVVTCGGVYGDPNQTKESGVAWIDLAASPRTMKIVAAKDFGRAFSPFDAAAVSSAQAFAITGGDFSGTPPDQLWAFDFAGGAPRKLLDGHMAFTLSGLVVDPAGKKLYVADGDAAAPRLHILDLAASAPTAPTSLVTNRAGLPPRYVSWY